VYFGALEEALTAAHVAMRESALLIFTLEAGKSDAMDYRLELHGRYVHSEMYVRRVITATGLKLVALSLETLRRERLQEVSGYVVVARRD
jgi:predicted TPR repeat methyltransferase